jgi:uncharacterized protein (TIGR03067 family)
MACGTIDGADTWEQAAMKIETNRHVPAACGGLICGLMVCWLTCPAVADEPASEADKARAALNGTWDLDSFINNGQQQELELRLNISKQDTTAMLGENKVEFRMVIDPACTPKVIDLTYISPDSGEPQAETTLEGIYEVSENKLRMCLATPQAIRARPQKFESPPDSQIVLLTFSRIAP